jgi:hypothetical protein
VDDHECSFVCLFGDDQFEGEKIVKVSEKEHKVNREIEKCDSQE